MANIFLDVNKIIELLEFRSPSKHFYPGDNMFFASPLAFHIIAYTFKLVVPDTSLRDFAEQLILTPLTQDLTLKALVGPTADLEDNIQLHSASDANCDIFLTSDKSLQKLGYFGQTRITDTF